MPVSRRKTKPEENGKAASGHQRVERLGGGMSSDAMEQRTARFQKALNRKGLPITWGTGIPRADKAWLRDREYLIEDGLFDKNGKVIR